MPSHEGQPLVTEHLKTSPIPSQLPNIFTDYASNNSLLPFLENVFCDHVPPPFPPPKRNHNQNMDVPRIIRLGVYKKPLDHQIPRYPNCLNPARDIFSFSTASGILKSFSLDNISSLIATFSLLYSRRATIVKILSGLLFLSKNRNSCYLK